MRTTIHNTRGAALVSVMIALIVLATMSVALSNLTLSNTGVVASTSDRQQALLLAQAGINMAISKVAKNGLGAIPNKVNAINVRWGFNHVVQVDKEAIGSDVKLTARGIILNKQGAGANQVLDASDLDLDGITTDTVIVAQRRVEGILHPTSGAGGFVYGAFGDSTLRFQSNGAQADSYDARGIPIMKKLNNGVDGIADTADDVFVPETGLVGYDGIAGTADDSESFGPDGVSGNADDIPFARYMPATYKQQAIAAPRIKGNASNTGANRPRPYTLADPITLAALTANPTAADLTAFHASGQAGSGGNVGSNGTVTIGNSSDIFGSATNGPSNGSPPSGGNVSGGRSTSTTVLDIPDPDVTPPATVTATYTTPPASLGNGTFKVTGGWPTGDYTITGNTVVYLTGNFILNNNDGIVIQPNASLTIYHISGDFDTRNGAEINVQGQKPSAFNLVSNSTGVIKLRGPTGGLYGTVYAPNAAIDLAGNTDAFGAMIGASFDSTGGGKFHWDKSARSPGIQTTVSLVAYRELD